MEQITNTAPTISKRDLLEDVVVATLGVATPGLLDSLLILMVGSLEEPPEEPDLDEELLLAVEELEEVCEAPLVGKVLDEPLELVLVEDVPTLYLLAP